jgi:hypothetical protein
MMRAIVAAYKRYNGNNPPATLYLYGSFNGYNPTTALLMGSANNFYFFKLGFKYFTAGTD